MRKLIGIIILFCILNPINSQSKRENIDTVWVKEKVIVFTNEIRTINSYPVIRNENNDSILTFNYSNNIYPTGKYRFNINNSRFEIISAPEEDSSIECVDTIIMDIRGSIDTLYKYEPTDLLDDGEGCLIISKKYGIIATSDYCHNVQRIITEWDGNNLGLDTLLNYNGINLLKNNKLIKQPPRNENNR